MIIPGAESARIPLLPNLSYRPPTSSFRPFTFVIPAEAGIQNGWGWEM